MDFESFEAFRELKSNNAIIDHLFENQSFA